MSTGNNGVMESPNGARKEGEDEEHGRQMGNEKDIREEKHEEKDKEGI